MPLKKPNNKRTLRLALNGEYFDQIVQNKKPLEYRLKTPYWVKRLVGREYDLVTFTKRYPKKTQTDRVHTVPYRGFIETTISHPHFGGEPVDVFAIRTDGKAAQ